MLQVSEITLKLLKSRPERGKTLFLGEKAESSGRFKMTYFRYQGLGKGYFQSF